MGGPGSYTPLSAFARGGMMAGYDPAIGLGYAPPTRQWRHGRRRRGGWGGGYGTAQRTVILRAPNGQTKAVPADQVQHYLARGAQQSVTHG